MVLSLLRIVFMPIAGGKIYLNCRWHLFSTLSHFIQRFFRDFVFFLVFCTVFVILWNVLSSLF